MLLAAMLAMVLVAAAPAFAQGQVERGPEHARSICSFSRLSHLFVTSLVRCPNRTGTKGLPPPPSEAARLSRRITSYWPERPVRIDPGSPGASLSTVQNCSL